MDLTAVAAELLDSLPAHRTLGLSMVRAVDGEGEVHLPVGPAVHNVIGSLHSSGVVALVDAAGLAALVAGLPDEATARRLQPLGATAELRFRRPVRGTARARCTLDAAAVVELARLVAGEVRSAVLRTHTTIDGDDEPAAATGWFDWSIRLARQSAEG